MPSLLAFVLNSMPGDVMMWLIVNYQLFCAITVEISLSSQGLALYCFFILNFVLQYGNSNNSDLIIQHDSRKGNSVFLLIII